MGRVNLKRKKQGRSEKSLKTTALEGLLKLNGLGGGESEADSWCNFTCWCRCWAIYAIKTRDLYTF